jgi:predicted ATP-dependent endonuclease of OLD family
MPILYFDNFRGFASTYLPLQDVNFFVGENSTGKTSVLKLIGILSSPGFWRYREFGKNETSLGGFSEIITSHNDGNLRTFFEIGILDEMDQRTAAIKLRFIEEDNYPVLKEVCFKDDFINLQAVIDGRTLKYRYEFLSKEPEQDMHPQERFVLWIGDNQLKSKRFSKTELESLGILPILSQIRSNIVHELAGDEVQSASFKSRNIEPPSFLNTLAWIAPVRAEPEKTYNHQGLIFNPEGRHALSVLKEIITGPDVKKILNRFGSDSGLYDDINIHDCKSSA